MHLCLQGGGSHSAFTWGQSHTRLWLAEHRQDSDLCSTLNIARDKLDDLRVPVRKR